jgi:hypothetical protein
LTIAIKRTHLTASKRGVVKIALKRFKRAATGVVTLRRGAKQIGRAPYKARSGRAVTVRIKLSAAARRSLERHRSLRVSVTATAHAGARVATKTIRARVHRSRSRRGRSSAASLRSALALDASARTLRQAF